MGFHSERVGRLLLVRWETVEAPDVLALLDAVRTTRAALGRAPILGAVLPESAEPPTVAVRDSMIAHTGELIQHLHCGFMVVEGSSLRAISNRLVMATILALSGHRDHARVCRSVDELVSLAGAELEATRSEVHAAAARLRSTEWPALSALPV